MAQAITGSVGVPLIGRETELEQLCARLEAARGGSGSAIVVVGEPGVGKTTLLLAASAAAAMRVVSVRGIEAESELGYGGLADVLRPLVDALDALVPQQRAVIDGILGIGPAAGDPLGTSASTLAVLAAAAEREPLLVLVDDVQWLDAPSRLVFSFVARRLEVERIVLLFGAREATPELEHSGIPELRLERLGDEDARELLHAHSPDIAPLVAAAIVETAAGNPLALVELTSFLEPEQLAGRAPLPSPLPVKGPVEGAFRERIQSLSPEARRALVVAAIDDTGDAAVIRRAMRVAGVEVRGLEEAEETGALTLGPPLRFRHPVLRSLAYQDAPDRERRSVHAALAEAIGDTDPYRRAWHAGRAALEPDEAVAQLLQDAAADARIRRQFSSAAAAGAESARLSTGPDMRARRLVLAASDYQLAGNFHAAEACLSEALGLTSDVVVRAEAQHARGQALFVQGRWAETIGLLEGEGESLVDVLPDSATRMLTHAAMACQPLGRIEEGLRLGRRAVDVAERASSSSQFAAQLVYAETLALRGDAQAVAELLASARAVAPLEDPMVAGMVLQSEAGYLMVLGQHAEARARVEQLVVAARDAGAAGLLPYPLGLLGEIELRSGRWAQGLAAAAEGVEFAEQTGQLAWGCLGHQVLVRLHGAMGHFEAAESHAARAQEITDSLGVDGMRFYLPAARSLLALTMGDLESAVDHGREVEEISRERGLREPAVVLWAPDLVEAYARLGRVDEARKVLERFTDEAEATGRIWALAAAARCRGLLDNDFEATFDAALEWHRRLDMPFERARTELCLGERRRRAGRRTDARAPLRSALHTFERLGAQPWAGRARAELGASGERVRRQVPALTDQLTAHELRVALVVARGATNREAAAELFVSPKTVDFHLRHVYRKLGIRSRAELGRLFAELLASPS